MSTPSSKKLKIIDSGSPFADADADIIIRSSDLHHFRLHRWLLSRTSDTFRDILSGPQPTVATHTTVLSDEYRDGLPVISVSENHRILDVLFRIIYPVDMPTIDSLRLGDEYNAESGYFLYKDGIGEISELLSAAEKYEVIERFPATFCSFLVSIPRIGYELHDHADPEAVLWLACRYGLSGAANEMVQRMLKGTIDQNTDHDDIQKLTVPQYRAILKYRELATYAAVDVIKEGCEGGNKEVFVQGNVFPGYDLDASPAETCTCQRVIVQTLPWHTNLNHDETWHYVRSPHWVQQYLETSIWDLRVRLHWDTVKIEQRMKRLVQRATNVFTVGITPTRCSPLRARSPNWSNQQS